MNSEIRLIKWPPNLSFKGESGNTQVPSWGYFFISLGELLSRSVADELRLIIALAVPARNFCSPLISFGYISQKIQSSQNNDHLEYAEYLKKLPLGTPVLLRSEVGKKFKGLLNGYRVNDGTEYFAVQYERSATRYIRIDESKRIEVLNAGINLPITQRGRALASKSKFCAAILGPEFSSLLASESYLETIIIGPKKPIEEEVTNQEFSTPEGQVGTLQEILRIREFQSITTPYRSRILSDRARATITHSSIFDPPLVIFDGAQSFLKWRSYWTNSNWIIVLDRTEYQFESAVEEVNRVYTLNRNDDRGLEITPLDVPTGIEIMSFGVNK